MTQISFESAQPFDSALVIVDVARILVKRKTVIKDGYSSGDQSAHILDAQIVAQQRNILPHDERDAECYGHLAGQVLRQAERNLVCVLQVFGRRTGYVLADILSCVVWSDNYKAEDVVSLVDVTNAVARDH